MLQGMPEKKEEKKLNLQDVFSSDFEIRAIGVVLLMFVKSCVMTFLLLFFYCYYLFIYHYLFLEDEEEKIEENTLCVCQNSPAYYSLGKQTGRLVPVQAEL